MATSDGAATSMKAWAAQRDNEGEVVLEGGSCRVGDTDDIVDAVDVDVDVAAVTAEVAVWVRGKEELDACESASGSEEGERANEGDSGEYRRTGRGGGGPFDRAAREGERFEREVVRVRGEDDDVVKGGRSGVLVSADIMRLSVTGEVSPDPEARWRP